MSIICLAKVGGTEGNTLKEGGGGCVSIPEPGEKSSAKFHYLNGNGWGK